MPGLPLSKETRQILSDALLYAGIGVFAIGTWLAFGIGPVFMVIGFLLAAAAWAFSL